MAETNTALYDFALAIHGDVDFGQIVEQISELQERFALSPPSVELYGRSQAGEIIVLYRFPFAAYSAALRSAASSRTAGTASPFATTMAARSAENSWPMVASRSDVVSPRR